MSESNNSSTIRDMPKHLVILYIVVLSLVLLPMAIFNRYINLNILPTALTVAILVSVIYFVWRGPIPTKKNTNKTKIYAYKKITQLRIRLKKWEFNPSYRKTVGLVSQRKRWKIRDSNWFPRVTIGSVTQSLLGLLLLVFVFGYYFPIKNGANPLVDIRYLWGITALTAIITFLIYKDTPKQRPKYQFRSYRKYIDDVELPDVRNRYFLAVVALILVGGTLRFYRLGVLSFTVDEIYNGMAIKAVQETGYPVFPDGTLYNRGLVHTYLGWFFAQLVGVNELSTRLPSAIAGTLLIPLVYFIGRDFSGERIVGVLCAGCIALFPWAIEFSRWGRFYMMASLLFLGTFYTAKKGFETRRLDIIGIAALLGLFSVINSKFGFIAIGVLPLAFLLWGFDRDQLSLSRTLVFGLATVLVIPVYRTIQGGISDTGPIELVTSLLSGYDFLFSYFGFDQYFVSNFHAEFGLLTVFFLLFIVSAFIATDSIKPKQVYLAAFAYGPLVLLTYYNLHNVPRYLFFVIPLFIVTGVIGAYKFSVKFAELADVTVDTNHRTAIVTVIALLCLVSFVNVGYAVDIPTRTHGEAYQNQFYSPSHEYQADSRSVNQYTATHKSEEDIVIAKHFQYYYFYADEEPEYWYRPGGHGFVSDDGSVSYMAETKGIANPSELKTVVKRHSGTTIWVPIATNLGVVDRNRKVIKAVEQLRGEYQVDRIEVGETDGPVVYRIENTK